MWPLLVTQRLRCLSPTSVPEFNFWLQLLTLAPSLCKPWEAVAIAQVIESLPSTWEGRSGFCS